MTAGAGLQHSEMFPLLKKDSGNPLELFQIWLNLPKARKFSQPYYKMLWAEDIPVYTEKDKNGKSTSVVVIAGSIGNVAALPSAPDSWANDPAIEVGIWLIKMEAGAQWILPPASFEVNRSLYFYKGSGITIEGININPYHSVDLLADQQVIIGNSDKEASLLLLQGKPINETVVQHGPFVMNTFEEIQQAYYDYRRTQFGGWPWANYENVHPPERGRFAKYADSTEEIR
jgi:redox-sensitive bicupin YhaK (pirin superfamily)